MTQRKLHWDLMRVFAIFAVVVQHVCNRCIRYATPDQLDWQVCKAVHSSLVWAVPIFVMISGALFLVPDKEFSIKKLYGKYILRLAIAYLFWSCINTFLFSTIKYYAPFSFAGIWNTFTGMLKGGYPYLWFLWMILGLYIMIPILRACLKTMSDTVLLYWLAAGFTFGCIIPLILNWNTANVLFGSNMTIMNQSMFGVYVFYFVLGYTLEHRPHLLTNYKLLYLAGILGVIVAVAGTAILSRYYMSNIVFLLENHSPAITFTSIAIYIGLRNYIAANQETGKITQLASALVPYVFGIYLVHNIFLDSVGIAIIEKYSSQIPLSVIMLILIPGTCVISLVTVWLIRLLKPIAKFIT